MEQGYKKDFERISPGNCSVIARREARPTWQSQAFCKEAEYPERGTARLPRFAPDDMPVENEIAAPEKAGLAMTNKVIVERFPSVSWVEILAMTNQTAVSPLH